MAKTDSSTVTYDASGNILTYSNEYWENGVLSYRFRLRLLMMHQAMS